MEQWPVYYEARYWFGAKMLHILLKCYDDFLL